LHVANRDDWLIIIGFLGAVLCVYGSSAFILLRAFLLPADRKTPIGLAGGLTLFAALCGVLCILYAKFIEPYSLEVTNIDLALPGIKHPCTLVQISDLHCDEQRRLEPKVLDTVRNLKPDAIVFTGDAINSLSALNQFHSFARDLAVTAPVYCIKGDWDFAFNMNDYLDTNWHLLSNRWEIIHPQGNDILLIGVDSGAKCAPVIALAPHITPTILLFHNPDADVVLNKETERIALYLCGHTHGGQIALPIYGALITQSIQGKRYERGLHKLNNMYLYTSRGIGMEGHFPRLRFFSKPEVTVFHLGPLATGASPASEQ